MLLPTPLPCFFPNPFSKIGFLLSPKYILQIMLTDVHKLQKYVHWENGVKTISTPDIVFFNVYINL